MNIEKVESGRLLGIDGLRGIAALAVVVFHLSAHFAGDSIELWPSFISTLFSYGYLGVPVFFVLSGFVIGGSIKNNFMGFGYIGRFIVRRSIRLDPVYWCAILLSVSLLYLKKYTLGFDVDFPSVSTIIVHVFYLQDLLRETHQISSVFWTLCLEIQFYIFFIVSLGFSVSFYGNKYLFSHTLVTVVIAGVSILIYVGALDFKVPGLFLTYWFFFALGVLLYRGLNYGGNYLICLYFVFFCGVIAMFFVEDIGYLLAATLTSLLIYYWAIKSKLKTSLGSRGWQFLGKISYSLYLTHPEVGWKFISAALKMFPGANSFLLSFIFCASVVVSILFAWAFYWLIERPSLNLSRKIKL